MKLLCTICALFLSTTFFCQHKDSTHSKVKIGIVFSPDRSYRTLKASGNDTWLKESYDTMEVARFSFTTGFQLVYALSEKLSVTTGLFLSDKGEKTKEYISPPPNNYVNHFYYLDIPVKFQYYIERKHLIKKTGKPRFFLTAGFSGNIFLKTKTVTTSSTFSEKEKFESNPNLSKINMAIAAGLGVDFPLTNTWDLRMEPIYRRSITSITKAPLKKYFYSFGLNIGLFHKF